MTKNNKLSGIKSWSEQDRPREKLLEKGTSALSDAELLAILISSGTKGLNALDVARQLLEKVNNDLNALGKLSIRQIISIKGIGHAKAITIAASLELGRRRKNDPNQKNEKITSSKNAYDFVYPFLIDAEKEKFIVLYLNRANVLIRYVEVSSGGLSGTVVDPKIIFKKALEELASSIILAHNHPSGNVQPSQADIDLTKKIVSAGKLLDINVLDHLIFTATAYYSFADENLI